MWPTSYCHAAYQEGTLTHEHVGNRSKLTAIYFMGPFHTVFTSSGWEYCQMYCCYCNYDYNDPTSSQICTWRDSSAVVSCAKLSPDWMIIFLVWATWILHDLDYELINPIERIPLRNTWSDHVDLHTKSQNASQIRIMWFNFIPITF